MKNLKDYIGKPFNIICDNKEEWDEIVEQAIELNYLLDGEVDIYIKNNYNANCYLSTAYKENLTIGVLPSSSERTEIKASEFISPCFKEGAYIVALKDRVASIPNFNIGCIGIALGKNNLQLDDLREYTLSKYQEKEGNVKSFKTKEEAEAFAETLKPKNAVVHCKTQEESTKPLALPRYVKWVANLGYDRIGKMTNTFIKDKVFDTSVDTNPIFSNWRECLNTYYFNFVEVGETEYINYHKMNSSLVTGKPEFKKGDKVLIIQDFSTGDGSDSLIQGTIGTFIKYNTSGNAKEYPYVVDCIANDEISDYCVHKIEHCKEKKSLDLSKPFCILLTLDNQVRVQNILGSSYFYNPAGFVFTDVGYYYGINVDGKIGSKAMLPTNLVYFANNEITIEELEQAYYSLSTQSVGRPIITKDMYKVVEDSNIFSTHQAGITSDRVSAFGLALLAGKIKEEKVTEFRLTKPTKTFKDTTIIFPTQINIKLKTKNKL